MPYVLNKKTPLGIDTVVRVKAKQRELGVEPDGIWRPKTEAAYQASLAGNAQPVTMANLKRAEQAAPSLTMAGLKQAEAYTDTPTAIKVALANVVMERTYTTTRLITWQTPLPLCFLPSMLRKVQHRLT